MDDCTLKAQTQRWKFGITHTPKDFWSWAQQHVFPSARRSFWNSIQTTKVGFGKWHSSIVLVIQHSKLLADSRSEDQSPNKAGCPNRRSSSGYLRLKAKYSRTLHCSKENSAWKCDWGKLSPSNGYLLANPTQTELQGKEAGGREGLDPHFSACAAPILLLHLAQAYLMGP